jgi:hypothetical protein
MKKAKTITITLLVFLSLAIVFSWVVFSAVLPAYLEKKFIPKLMQQSGIEGFSWNVRKVGITGADFGAIRIGEQPEKALSVASIQIKYNLFGLIRRHLKSIHICGLSLSFELREGKIFFPGIDLDKVLSQSKPSDENKFGTKLSLPVSFDRIVIDQAVITATMNQRVLRLPLNGTMVPLNENFDHLRCEINLYPFQSSVYAEVQLDLASNHLKIFFDGQNLRLENFLSLLTSEKNLQLKGDMGFTAYSEINLESFDISTVNILVESKDFLFLSGNLKLEKSKENDEAFIIKIQGEKLTEWNITTSGMTVISPALLEISEIQVDLAIGPNILDCHFQLDTVLKGFGNQYVEINPYFRRKWSGSAKLYDNTDWVLNMDIKPPEELLDKQSSEWYRIEDADMDIGFFMPQVTVTGSGNLERGNARGDLKMSGIYLDIHALSAELPSLTFNAEMVSDIKEDEKARQFNFNARLMNTAIRLGATKAKFPDISLLGQSVLTGSENVVHATFKISGGELSDSMYDAGIQGLSLELPLIWPLSHQVDAGSFVIDVLRFKEKNLGKIRASLRQNDHGGEIKGKYDSRLLPGLSLYFDGRMGSTRKGLETRINFEMPEYKIRNTLNLGDFFPGADGIFLNGQVGLKGDFYNLGQKMNSSVHVGAQSINISMEEPEIAVNNARIDFTLADLFELRSLPHQFIQFDSASIGKIILNDGSVYFQMQSIDHFFIEKTNFKWCEGNVDTNAVILSIPIENVGLTFYCDRLKLAQVLEQLGDVEGQGEGAVNGRIPVRYENGKIIFDDGFLYSTPGDGGTIRLTGTEVLMAGIPEGTPQFSQIDLAREALKHYNYSWAKLEITTQRDNLYVQLKMDGKPVEVLPFEYRQDFGGFVRVDADSPGSKFQGIRLDVNFNLPLDQILKYGKGFQDLFKKGD